MPKKQVTTEQIDAVLPQTQCTLCSYDGCLPYAQAIADHGEAITLCPPGGVEGLKKLAAITGEDPTPFIDSMRLQEKPPMLAKIREHECIGCTKCIQACPVDAIIGAGKVMHVVIEDECTGCELCIEPCPVDCIDMIQINPYNGMDEEKTAEQKSIKSDQYRARYRAHNERLAQEAIKKAKRHQMAKHAFDQSPKDPSALINAKKAAVEAAIQRAKAKRGS